VSEDEEAEEEEEEEEEEDEEEENESLASRKIRGQTLTKPEKNAKKTPPSTPTRVHEENSYHLFVLFFLFISLHVQRQQIINQFHLIQ
jgi:hypothetical protein